MEIVAHSTFVEVAALLVVAAIGGFIGIMLRQPLIVSFIAVGLLVGPSFLDIVRSDEQIDLLSELGIAVLLFLVGIKLDVKLIRSLGAVALMTGLGQVAFTSIFGFLIGLALGFGAVTSLYVAVALTFSSTIIIVKLLSDKREIDWSGISSWSRACSSSPSSGSTATPSTAAIRRRSRRPWR